MTLNNGFMKIDYIDTEFFEYILPMWKLISQRHIGQWEKCFVQSNDRRMIYKQIQSRYFLSHFNLTSRFIFVAFYWVFIAATYSNYVHSFFEKDECISALFYWLTF